MSPADLGRYVSGGYFIGRRTPRAEYMNPVLLPSRILTASDCITDVVPDARAITWTNSSPERKSEQALRFGLAGAAAGEFTDWCTNALDSGELAWPSVFMDVDVARRVRARFFSSTDGAAVFGIALPGDLVSSFLEATRPAAGEGEPGVLVALRRGARPSCGGVALGFDVLGWDHGAFHSYICNSLENDFASLLGVRPNRHGLFDAIEDARKCADYSNLETTAAEPALWLPWLTLLYDGDVAAGAP